MACTKQAARKSMGSGLPRKTLAIAPEGYWDNLNNQHSKRYNERIKTYASHVTQTVYYNSSLNSNTKNYCNDDKKTLFDLKNQLKCNICADLYIQPITLKCGHTHW